MLTELFPEQANDFIATFIKQYEQGGRLPIWELSSNETNCMIGYHAIPVIWDTYQKGIRKYDANRALAAMKSIATEKNDAVQSYIKNGYVRADDDAESVSKTLEFAYDDWCIAQMALALFQENKIANSTSNTDSNFVKKQTELWNDYQTFSYRSNYWKNVFDPSTGFMRARLNGVLYSPFSPYTVDNNYTEANSWQYSFLCSASDK